MIALAWVVALGALTIAFTNLLEQQNNPNSEPASFSGNAYREVVLVRNRYNHYVSSGKINGHGVTFMIDTGATQVALSPRLAKQLSLKPGVRGAALTANGVTQTTQTRIDTLQLGDILLQDVAASITDGMTGDEVLLGMSALKNIEFTHRSGALTLRQYLPNSTAPQ